MSRTLFFSLISSRPELTYYEGEESPRILEILDALEQAENYKLFHRNCSGDLLQKNFTLF